MFELCTELAGYLHACAHELGEAETGQNGLLAWLTNYQTELQIGDSVSSIITGLIAAVGGLVAIYRFYAMRSKMPSISPCSEKRFHPIAPSLFDRFIGVLYGYLGIRTIEAGVAYQLGKVDATNREASSEFSTPVVDGVFNTQQSVSDRSMNICKVQQEAEVVSSGDPANGLVADEELANLTDYEIDFMLEQFGLDNVNLADFLSACSSEDALEPFAVIAQMAFST